MSIIDFLKNEVFNKKPLTERLNEWVEAGNSPRIVKYIDVKYDEADRIAAIRALSGIQRDELAVNTCMKLVGTEDESKAVKLAALKTLERIGTKREVDQLYHIEELESDEELKKAYVNAAIASKERSPRFI